MPGVGKTHFLQAVFLSRLQKSRRMQTHTHSKLIWTKPSRMLAQKLGTCQQTSHLAQGTTSRLTVVVTAPGSGSGLRPVLSEAGVHNHVTGPPPAFPPLLLPPLRAAGSSPQETTSSWAAFPEELKNEPSVGGGGTQGESSVVLLPEAQPVPSL